MVDALLGREYSKFLTPEDREKLIIEHLHLVKQIAARISINLPNHLDKEDLVSFGIIGLMDAIEKYNPATGAKFSSYAYIRIKGSIYDELRKNSPLPRNIVQKMKEYYNAEIELEQLYGEKVTNDLIAKKMGMSSDELVSLLHNVSMFSMSSLDEILELGDNEKINKIELVQDYNAINPLKSFEKKEELELLTQAISNLAERDRLLLSLYYYEELTLFEIGEVLEISESRVCQLHGRALIRMRNELEKLKFEKVK